MAIEDRGYAYPDALVSTDWVAEHLNDPAIRLVESNEDILLYDVGHIPGAVKVDWHADLNDPLVRDYIGRPAFEALMRRLGIGNDTTVVFYGDKNNWWATYAYWVFQLFGHTNAKIMDGGRMKWIAEERELTREVPSLSGHHLRGETAQRQAGASSARRGPDPHRGRQTAGRCAEPGRVQGRVAAHGRLSPGGRDARRTHSWREECALGACG